LEVDSYCNNKASLLLWPTLYMPTLYTFTAVIHFEIDPKCHVHVQYRK